MSGDFHKSRRGWSRNITGIGNNISVCLNGDVKKQFVARRSFSFVKRQTHGLPADSSLELRVR